MLEHVLVWWFNSAFHTKQINCWCKVGVCYGDANIARLLSLWQARYRVRNNYRPCVKVLRYHTIPQLPMRNDVWHFRSPHIQLVLLLEFLCRYSRSNLPPEIEVVGKFEWNRREVTFCINIYKYFSSLHISRFFVNFFVNFMI